MEEIQFIEKGSSKNCLLLIHGFCSGPEDWKDQIKKFSTNNEVFLLENTGHYISIEKPQIINKIILDWLIRLKVHF